MRNPFRRLRLSRLVPQFVSRALRDRRGVSAVAFAITFAVLAPMSLGLFDVYQANEQHGKLQDALDAATLYAARSTATDNPTLNSIGNKALAANLQLVPGATLTSSSFALVNNNTQVQAQAAVQLSAFSPMTGHSPVQASSEVTRNGNNIEVAMVLDNTGSMLGSPMTSLQSAANQLIDLVVSNTQTPFYSKIAIVPYSNAVNAGAYAATVRGAFLAATDTNCKNGADKLGCPSYKFTNMNGQSTIFSTDTNCVSERTGAHAFDDASYTAGLVGWVYPPSNENHCIAASIQPLTSDKTALHNTISTLTADGSTAGQIGVAWGWYMVSPNWASLFPTASQAVAYGTPNTLKAVILMTDGAFNTTYCNGVISKDSPSGSGSPSNHINCNAPNGDAFTQAQSLCNAMKAPPNNIIIYTVGFLHGGADPQAQAILANCATDAAHAYLPTTGGALQVAFQAIAADLNKLRISH
jgi:Flp pilus assembly protein TadG